MHLLGKSGKKDSIMNISTWLKTGALALSVSLLAACGGSDSPVVGGSLPSATPTVNFNNAAWASPAVFVPPSASNKTFALSCTKFTELNTVSYEGVNVVITTLNTRDQLYTATLKISTNGDTVVSAATSTTGTISALQSIALVDANEYSWNVNGTIQTPTYSLSVRQNSSKSLNIYISGESYVLSLPTETTYGGDFDSTMWYECTMTDPLALQINADAARAAKNLGAEAGITTFDDDDTTGRIEGGQAFWLSGRGSEEFNYIRFNLGSGELASSAFSTGTYSPFSLSLPSSNAEYGIYGESVIRNNSLFDNLEAKTVCLDYEAEIKRFSISATAYGNKFRPNGSGRVMVASGFETPQGRLSACDSRR
jgi:hypothetical protein